MPNPVKTVTRAPNSIEKGQEMSCVTCKHVEKCRYTYRLHDAGKTRQICRYYCNPDKGCYDDSGRRKVE